MNVSGCGWKRGWEWYRLLPLPALKVGEGILKAWLLGADHSMGLEMKWAGGGGVGGEDLHLPILHNTAFFKGLGKLCGGGFILQPRLCR